MKKYMYASCLCCWHLNIIEMDLCKSILVNIEHWIIRLNSLSPESMLLALLKCFDSDNKIFNIKSVISGSNMTSLNNYTSPHRIKGNGFNSQARKLILNVLDFFHKCGKNPDLLKASPVDNASKALNISTRSFSNIKNKYNKEGKLETSKRKTTSQNS